MNAAVHVMCFYYSSWNDKIYANIKISKVGKTWLSTCTPVYSFSVVRTADTGGADTRFLQPWTWKYDSQTPTPVTFAPPPPVWDDPASYAPVGTIHNDL